MAKKRGNNEGSITRRPDGRWMQQLTQGRDPTTGKPKRATFYGKTRQEVAEKLTKALREKQGTFVAPHKLTLGEWLETWLWEYKHPGIRAGTLTNYASLVRCHLKPALGHLGLQERRPEHVRHYCNEKMQQGLAVQTIRLHHVILSNVLALAEKHSLVARNVCRLVEPPRPKRKERRTLAIEEVTTGLLPTLKGHRLFAAFLTLFMMG